MSPVSSGSQVINTEVEGDPNGCQASANQLSALASLLQRISRDNTSASRAIVDAWKGIAANAFEEYALDLDRNIDQLSSRLNLAREGLATFAEILKQVMSGMAMLRGQAAAAGLRVDGFNIYAPVAGPIASLTAIARLQYQQAVFMRCKAQASKLRQVEDSAHEHLRDMLRRLDSTKWSLRKRPGGPGGSGGSGHLTKRKVTSARPSKKSKGFSKAAMRKFDELKSKNVDGNFVRADAAGPTWSAVAPAAATAAVAAGGLGAVVAGARTGAVAAKASTASAASSVASPVKAVTGAAEAGGRMPMMPMGMGGMGAGGAVGANGAVKGGLAAGKRGGMLSGRVASSVLGSAGRAGGDKGSKASEALTGGPAGAAKNLVDEVKSGGASLPW